MGTVGRAQGCNNPWIPPFYRGARLGPGQGRAGFLSGPGEGGPDGTHPGGGRIFPAKNRAKNISLASSRTPLPGGGRFTDVEEFWAGPLSSITPPGEGMLAAQRLPSALESFASAAGNHMPGEFPASQKIKRNDVKNNADMNQF